MNNDNGNNKFRKKIMLSVCLSGPDILIAENNSSFSSLSSRLLFIFSTVIQDQMVLRSCHDARAYESVQGYGGRESEG